MVVCLRARPSHLGVWRHAIDIICQRAVREQTMAQESLETRMDSLERRMEILERLPDRVTALESQIVQLRDEMRSEFSAVRTDIRTGDEETRRMLTERMESLFDANERHMRLLHEDLVERLARSSEGR
jgi:predicted  nucleic acid-binding Zn-ribbon protein